MSILIIVFLEDEWDVWVTTGPKPNMGTKNTVFMQVYGDSGASEPRKLGKGGINFKAGNTDEFLVRTDYLYFILKKFIQFIALLIL